MTPVSHLAKTGVLSRGGLQLFLEEFQGSRSDPIVDQALCLHGPVCQRPPAFAPRS